MLTKSFLETSEAMEVGTVCSVTDARTALGQKHYGAIVSDYQMPIEDGIQFLKSLRGNGDHIPFILFTGKGREEVVIEALNNGADSYLQKGGKPTPQYAELEHHIGATVQKYRSEEALRESENNLAHAERVAGLGHWRLDANTQVISGSEEAIAICGLDKRSMEYSDFRKIIVSDYVPLLNQSMKGLIEEGKSYDVEVQIRRKSNGKIIDIHSIAEYDHEKKVVFGTLQDITIRKRAEETAASKERSLRDRAEEKLTRSPKFSPELEEQATMRLIHELQVHQVELEMQSQELQRAQTALEESRDKYQGNDIIATIQKMPSPEQQAENWRLP